MFKLRQLIPKEACLKCNGCCRFSGQDSVWSPQLLNEESKGVLSGVKSLRPIPNAKQNNFICPFLNTGDNKCKIYRLRPFECRLYPFLINRSSNKVFLALDLNCPFAKENLITPRFKEYIDYLARFLNRPKVCGILKENQHIVCAYPEVLNLTNLKF